MVSLVGAAALAAAVRSPALVRPRRAPDDGPSATAAAPPATPAWPGSAPAPAAATPRTGPARCSPTPAAASSSTREFELRTAEQVAETLGHMKGALMKLGQMASYLDQGLPEHVRERAGRAPAQRPADERRAGRRRDPPELGGEPDEVFAEWDPTPIASASIGQVHRAITHDGRAVAVKVQYPGVAEAVAADLDNVGLIFGGLGQLFPGLDHKSLVAELRERLVEELDYTAEAAPPAGVRPRTTTAIPPSTCPRWCPTLSTRRVLTTELADGVRWEELLTWRQDEKDLAAETLYRFAFGSLYRLRAFNGDPHPGNYLFHPGGQVTFLDFGLVKHFTQAELDDFGEMIQHMVIEHDPAAFRRHGRAHRPAAARAPRSPTTRSPTTSATSTTSCATTAPYTITPEYAAETVRRFFDTSGPYATMQKAANVPQSFVIIQRINLGPLRHLRRARGHRRTGAASPRSCGPSSTARPSTPMAERIDEWRRRRRPEATGAKL